MFSRCFDSLNSTIWVMCSGTLFSVPMDLLLRPNCSYEFIRVSDNVPLIILFIVYNTLFGWKWWLMDYFRSQWTGVLLRVVVRAALLFSPVTICKIKPCPASLMCKKWQSFRVQFSGANFRKGGISNENQIKTNLKRWSLWLRNTSSHLFNNQLQWTKNKNRSCTRMICADCKSLDKLTEKEFKF